MIAFTKTPAEHFPRTLQRLQDAEAAIGKGDFTTAVLLIRTAVDTAARETFGRSMPAATFLYVVTQEVEVADVTRRKVRKMRYRMNAVAHGGREGYAREARRMLILFRAVAARWLRRAELVADACGAHHELAPQLSPEELTSIS